VVVNKVRQISCEEALQSLLEYIDRELAGERSDQIEQHLSTCHSCYSRLQFEKRLKSRLQETGRQQVSDSLRQRIDKLFVSPARKQSPGG
jgi:mycothiol system anti-sigma-R factor